MSKKNKKENLMSILFKNKKENLMSILLMIIVSLLCFIGGTLSSRASASNNTSLLELSLEFIIFIVIFNFHMIIHEIGHLILGLLTGYEFVSFRIGSITVIRDNNKFKLKKFKIKGTAGQCLMIPKCDNYEECKYILYNLGGVIFNIITLILPVILYLKLNFNSYIEKILNNNKEKVEELYTRELKKYIKLTKCYVSRKRLMYAYNLIILNDYKKAEKEYCEFEKLKTTYPCKGDIYSEEDVMNLIKENYRFIAS